jgi:hypothetical protein
VAYRGGTHDALPHLRFDRPEPTRAGLCPVVQVKVSEPCVGGRTPDAPGGEAAQVLRVSRNWRTGYEPFIDSAGAEGIPAVRFG